MPVGVIATPAGFVPTEITGPATPVATSNGVTVLLADGPGTYTTSPEFAHSISVVPGDTNVAPTAKQLSVVLQETELRASLTSGTFADDATVQVLPFQDSARV